MMVAEKDYGVRIIRPYLNFRVGAVVFPVGMLRQKLIQAGFAVPEEPPVVPASAPDAEPTAYRRIKRRGE